MSNITRRTILKAIIKNTFWLAICVGFFIAYPDKGFLRFICVVYGISNGVHLYKNIFFYIQFPLKQKQAEFNKQSSDFKKQMDDWAKKIYEQQHQQRQTLTVKPEMSIGDAYRLMKLKYTDSPEFIKKRYRELAMQWHPDKFATENNSKQETANRNFQKLNTAYNVIKKHKNIA